MPRVWVLIWAFRARDSRARMAVVQGLGGEFGHRYPSRARQARYRERLRGPSSNTTGTIPADEARAPQTWGLDGFSCLLSHAFGVRTHIGRCEATGYQGVG